MDRLTEWVTIETFPFLGEAEAARSFLTGLGIESRLLDAHIVGINWLATIALGGVRLQVPSNLVLDARAALDAEAPLDEEALAAEAGVPEEMPAQEPAAERPRTMRVAQVVVGSLLLLALLRVLANLLGWRR